MDACPICMEPMKYIRGEVHSVTCPRCGVYRISDEAISEARNSKYDLRQRANASGWLAESRGYLILTTNLEQLYSQPTPSFHDRADKLLFALERQTEHLGQVIKFSDSWIGSCWCMNKEELFEIIDYLATTFRILVSENGNGSEKQFKIAPAGWEHLESLKGTNIESNQGFVAMWFDDRMQNVYDTAISLGVLNAGYKPHRVDQREHNNKIDDEIIAQIRRSRFVVADFTGHRGGVYYEAGFSQGIGLEVIWTCEKKDIKNLHFDIRQYNCIPWENDALNDFEKKLTFRIESVLGQGNYRIPT